MRLTGPLRSIPHFEENMLVDIDIDEKSIQIYPRRTKSKKKILKEEDLLKGLTEKTAHADELFQVTLKEFGD